MEVIREWDSQAVQLMEQFLVESIARSHQNTSELALVGIANGGLNLCSRLTRALTNRGLTLLPSGTIDITFHRDDVGQRPVFKIASPTDLPFAIDGATIILIDDVLSTGRTVRAALSEIFDQGRPALVELAVLFDRQTWRLPIRADHVAASTPTETDDLVKVFLHPEPSPQDNIIISRPIR
jgi:pyrimidine operon attenuation protein/uracil phosphoribosyltransferase